MTLFLLLFAVLLILIDEEELTKSELVVSPWSWYGQTYMQLTSVSNNPACVIEELASSYEGNFKLHQELEVSPMTAFAVLE